VKNLQASSLFQRRFNQNNLSYVPLVFKRLSRKFRPETIFWALSGYLSPYPSQIKFGILMRYSRYNDIWVESGTYLGETTKLLSKNSKKVYSVEPQKVLFNYSTHRLRKNSNIVIINGVSEEIFPDLLSKLDGDISFWLDGHFSGDITFEGKTETPIMAELLAIEQNFSHFGNVSIFIDDVRNFSRVGGEANSYPTLDYLANFCQKNRLVWHIEKDIFIARRFS
jgi:hypothetical protein